MALLEISGLEVAFPSPSGPAYALRGVDLALERGARLGVVGESGAGKSMVAFSILNLISEPGRIAGGSILFDGMDLTRVSDRKLRDIRGGRIAMIFQDPMMTLNPVLTIERQMVETLQAHRDVSHAAARRTALEALKAVAIPSAETRLDGYPHELSGGLRQRVVIAIALMTDPEIIIADEPTTALDVTIQAEVMSLLLKLCTERNLGLILITHDLALVAEPTERLMVMYAGRVVEEGRTAELIARPRHPYTRGLINALPEAGRRGAKLNTIPGSMPGVWETPEGCAFHPRCGRVKERCRAARPELESRGGGGGPSARRVACFDPILEEAAAQ